jgi:hypothetical protein
MLKIVLDGSLAGRQVDGLTIVGSNTTVRGLVVDNFDNGAIGHGIAVSGANNVVAGNFVGIDVAGLVARGNGDGIDISGDYNTIGGTTPEAITLAPTSPETRAG